MLKDYLLLSLIIPAIGLEVCMMLLVTTGEALQLNVAIAAVLVVGAAVWGSL